MTAMGDLLWVQELLLSRGLTVLVDVKVDGTCVFTCGVKSQALPCTDLITRNVYELADALQAALA